MVGAGGPYQFGLHHAPSPQPALASSQAVSSVGGVGGPSSGMFLSPLNVEGVTTPPAVGGGGSIAGGGGGIGAGNGTGVGAGGGESSSVMGGGARGTAGASSMDQGLPLTSGAGGSVGAVTTSFMDRGPYLDSVQALENLQAQAMQVQSTMSGKRWPESRLRV